MLRLVIALTLSPWPPPALLALPKLPPGLPSLSKPARTSIRISSFTSRRQVAPVHYGPSPTDRRRLRDAPMSDV